MLTTEEKKARKQASAKRYYENNKDKLKMAVKVYREKNSDAIKEKKRIRHLNNKEADNLKNKAHKKRNPEKWKTYDQEYYKNNRDKILVAVKTYNTTNRKKRQEYIGEYNKLHKVELAHKRKTYQLNNRERTNSYFKKKRKTDAKFRIAQNLRGRLYNVLKRRKINKSWSVLELVGCSLDELKNYLQSLFQPGMTWENQGEWHIDHIKPCASFDLTNPEEQKKCFHFSNLQPLWAIDNVTKKASLNWGKKVA